jgi:hypothetical protein
VSARSLRNFVNVDDLIECGRGELFVDALLQALCFCVSVTGAVDPYPQTAQQAGDIWFTHERLGHGKHLLRLSARDLILDSDRFRVGRMETFAQQFADQTCHGRYKLTDGERASSPKIRPIYAKQFVFRCV